MTTRTKRNLPKGQDDKVIRTFGVILECNIEDRDHPKCKLVTIQPIPESEGREAHPVTRRRTANKHRRSPPIKEEEAEVEQDLPANPDDIEVLEESDEELAEDDDELDEDSTDDETSDEDEEDADEEDADDKEE